MFYRSQRVILKLNWCVHFFLWFCMRGKVHIRYPHNNEAEVAYILRQHRKILHILTESEAVGTCTKPTYCTNTNAYLVDVVTDGQVTNSRHNTMFVINKYHPIRIHLLINRAEMRITRSWLVYKKRTNRSTRIKPQHCS